MARQKVPSRDYINRPDVITFSSWENPLSVIGLKNNPYGLVPDGNERLSREGFSMDYVLHLRIRWPGYDHYYYPTQLLTGDPTRAQLASDVAAAILQFVHEVKSKGIACSHNAFYAIVENDIKMTNLYFERINNTSENNWQPVIYI